MGDAPRRFVEDFHDDKVVADCEFLLAEGREGEDGCFPHLYNGNQLGKNEVDSVASVNKAHGEKWEQALRSIVPNGWLSY